MISNLTPGKFAFCFGVALAAIAPLQSAAARPFTVAHQFIGHDGAYPAAPLIVDKNGIFYGTTAQGGVTSCYPSGCGTIFRFTPKDQTDGKAHGKEEVLYKFKGGADGANPAAALLLDKAGSLYGTTESGGAANSGTVFKLASDGTETILHNFTGDADGYMPQGGLVSDRAGNLYGTTFGGGLRSGYSGFGTIFRISPAGDFAVIYTFCPNIADNCPDGAQPVGPLTIDKAGNLYGTASSGGHAGGTIYKLAPDGSFTVLHTMDVSEGTTPLGGVIRDGEGDLYGTCSSGGQFAHGSVFKFAPGGAFTALHYFGYTSDGATPMGELVRDKRGNLYGTTAWGGYSVGIVYRIAPGGQERILYQFSGQHPKKGMQPRAGLTFDALGNLYGTTSLAGKPFQGEGTIFKIEK